MFQLDELALPVAQQLALDECLLLESERRDCEYLRLWELSAPAVILGRGSQLQSEVYQERCQAASVPILRRCSGGATVVGGPGCLFYSVVLSKRQRPELEAIERAHAYVLNRLNLALNSLGCSTKPVGTSDIAMETESGLKKVSGNSLRLRRDSLLYHGTVLYDADIGAMAQLLKSPPRQPDYRAGRDHAQFITNLPADRLEVRAAIEEAWAPLTEQADWPSSESRQLAQEKYETEAWTERL